jgi:hypothetical protein
MRRNELGIYGDISSWTNSSIMCYNRRCRCDGCFYQLFFKDSEDKCKMKSSVMELVKKLGIPKKEEMREGYRRL